MDWLIINGYFALISSCLNNLQIFLTIFSLYNINNINKDFCFQPLWSNKNQIFSLILNNCQIGQNTNNSFNIGQYS